MNIPFVSVIIVNWNGSQYLHSCLSALYRQTYSHLEIVIVDNASTDDSCRIIEDFQSYMPELGQDQSNVVDPASDLPSRSLRLIRNTSNEGFCRGNNQGILHSHGEFILLLNADVTLEPRFIELLVDLMRSDHTVGIAPGKLLNGLDPTKLDSTGIVIYKNRRAVDRGQGEDDLGQYDSQEEVFGASGAACLYRRAMLEDIKYCQRDLKSIRPAKQSDTTHDEYLDEMFFAYKEDVDLSWRARLCGWKCVYVPEAVGRHFRKWGTGKRSSIPKWVRRHSLKNRYLMLLKNERWETIAPHILIICWYELRSFTYILLREPYLFSVFEDIFRLWSEIREKRHITQQQSFQKTPSQEMVSWFQ